MSICFAFRKVVWFENGAFPFRVLTKTLQTMDCCHAPPAFLSSPPLLRVTGEQNWRHKRWRSWVKVRTIYWKQAWDKKRNSNSNNTNDRVHKKRNMVAHPRNPQQHAIPLTSLCHSTPTTPPWHRTGAVLPWLEGTPCHWKRLPVPRPWQWHDFLENGRLLPIDYCAYQHMRAAKDIKAVKVWNMLWNG